VSAKSMFISIYDIEEYENRGIIIEKNEALVAISVIQ
jgi:hypothetical protein